MTAIVLWLTERGLSTKAAKALLWFVGTLAVIGIVLGAVALWLSAHDADVIDDHLSEQRQLDIEARSDSAEDRAYDAIQGIIEKGQRQEAIDAADKAEQAKPPEQRATLSPQDRALACVRLRQNYTPKELAAMPAYKENCV